ncbi:MAG: hypothetical protein HYX56_02380 [Chloroflexi bacterium]|nr:hypothetical protein [Chloroflexota bacterium]
MLDRSGHRARWIAAGAFLMGWALSLMFDWGGGLGNLLLILGVVTLLYELLAVDRA